MRRKILSCRIDHRCTTPLQVNSISWLKIWRIFWISSVDSATHWKLRWRFKLSSISIKQAWLSQPSLVGRLNKCWRDRLPDVRRVSSTWGSPSMRVMNRKNECRERFSFPNESHRYARGCVTLRGISNFI